MSLTGKEQYSISSHCRNSIISYIEYWIYFEDSKRFINSDNHISFDDSYKRIVYELSTMDDRFYEMFDAQHPGRCPTKNQRRELAVPELIKMLDIIYWTSNYSAICNDELVDDHDNDKQSVWIKPYMKLLKKVRKQCATLIWREWAKELLRGPRFGVILISNIKTSVVKVLLVAYIKNGQYNYSYPKGKPRDGERIIDGAYRETSEETGIDIMYFSIYTPENGGVVVRKVAYINYGRQRRSREYYYLITQTSLEYQAFKPQKNEIEDVVWHPVNTIPCSDGCKIRQKVMYINKDEGIPINYHMVTLRDMNNKNPVILDILNYTNKENDNKDASISYFHIHRRCGHDLEFL